MTTLHATPPPNVPRSPERIFFVYALLDDGRPFYVGLSSNERRLFEHTARARRKAGIRSTTKARDETICRILAEGRKLKLRKIATGLSYDEARARKRRTIAMMGQLHKGTGLLVNGENVSLANAMRRGLKWNSTAEDIGTTIVGNVSENKAREIAKAITAALDKASSKPAG